MGKNSKKNKQRILQAQQYRSAQEPSTPSVPGPATGTTAHNGSIASSDISQMHQLATAAMEEADLEALPQAVGALPELSPEALIHRGREALALLQLQQTRLSENLAHVEAMKAELAAERERLRTQAAEQQETAKRLDARTKEAAETEAIRLGEQEKLLVLKAEAESGFARRNRESLAALEAEIVRMREELAGYRARIAEELAAKDVELRRREQESNSIIEQQEQQLESETRQARESLKDEQVLLQAEQARVRNERLVLEVDQEILAERQRAFEVRVEKVAAARLEANEAAIAAMEERLASARAGRDDLERRLADRREADRRFGGRSPEEILEDLRALTEERDRLEAALSARPSEAAVQRLKELEEERVHWEDERLRFLQELSNLRQDVIHKRIAVTELETLRDHKAALESSNKVLQMALEEEVRKVNDLVCGSNGSSPFPSCRKMDSDEWLQKAPLLPEDALDLKKLADHVRNTVAGHKNPQKRLFYSEADIRCFIGGLAASRLHLLQGISGTGKTSLPIAFAQAIGAEFKIIEVQAGWRDRQDLIGHFNTFERRFYEQEFLQGLYKAGCPACENRPFIMVLDEMNLSHPEQYFADLLSALELKPEDQKLVLMTAAVDEAPRQFSEGGRVLQLPANVWFVGTANHDETTKDFADKTYDRAHVMELPDKPEQFEAQRGIGHAPVAMSALEDAFKAAEERHSDAAERCAEFLSGNLRGILGDRFRIGWGNRLKRQIKRFVPVVIECGGSIGEATDHLLATKLLRKLRDRHENRPQDLIELRALILARWESLERTGEAMKSLGMLKKELLRLGHSDD